MQKKYIGLLCSIAILIIGIIFLIGINGKQSDSSEEITRYHWIEMLCEYSGMVEYENEEPYFPDVNKYDLFFTYVQSACEWDVIERSIKFRGNDLATGEFIAVTALKSIGNSKIQTLFDSDRVLSDDELVKLAVENDIISNSDLKKNFTVKKCSDVLDKIDELNYGKIFSENYTEIILKEGIVEISDSDILGHNDEYSEVTVPREIIEKLDYNNSILLEDEKGLKFIKRVVDIGENSIILGDNVDVSDVLDELVSYESHEIEFEDIVHFYGFDDSEKVIPIFSSNSKYTVTQLNSKKQNKGFKLAIYSGEGEPIEVIITDNETEDSYVLPMPEEIELGVEFNAEVDVQKIICTPYVEYNALDGVRYAEVALDIESVMSGKLNFAIPEIEPIPLFTFTVPLANGFAQIDVQIYMQIEADGSISFSAKVPIQSSVCYEKGKGVRRVNREVTFEEPTIHANCSLEAGVHFQPILTILKCLEVMEAQLEVGITAEAEAVTYINEQTCVDVNSAYPIVSISIGEDEDRKNVLTMLDLSKEWEIVSVDEAPFQFHVHWEFLADGKEQFVDKCTYRGEKVEKKQEQELSVENNFDNTYYTKYSEYNQCDRPTFCFDYPDNWTITRNDVTGIIEERTPNNYYGELVEMKNENGTTIRYTQWERIYSTYDYGYTYEYDIEKICEHNISPVDSNANDNKKYMIAKIHNKKCISPEGEVYDDDVVYYAIIPEGREGEYVSNEFETEERMKFEYDTFYSFVARAPLWGFKEEEEKEVIKILSSFRLADSKEVINETIDNNAIFEQLQKGDFSYYAGTYIPVYSYNSETDIILQDNGIVKGGHGDYYTFPEIIPENITKKEDGTYLCQLTYGNEYEQSYYIIYPPGVVKDAFEYAEHIIENKVLLEEAFFIYYVQIDGGVGDCLYYRLPDRME